MCETYFGNFTSPFPFNQCCLARNVVYAIYRNALLQHWTRGRGRKSIFQRCRCCECYRVQNSSLSQQVLSEIVELYTLKIYIVYIFCLRGTVSFSDIISKYKHGLLKDGKLYLVILRWFDWTLGFKHAVDPV